MSSQLIYLPPDRLKRHPENIRIYYPPADVAEMAQSIRANNGVIQALLVVPIPGADDYHVVDGNLRLTAGYDLGDDCPSLKCEVIEADHARQLLVMAATGLHYPKDPVSEGRHYRRLIDQEGFTVGQIAEQTGISHYRIDKCLVLLDLDDDIQHLMIEGKLSTDPRVTRALLGVPDPALRLKLARRFAKNGTTIKYIVRGCRQVTDRAAQLGALTPDQVEQVDLRRAKILNYSQARRQVVEQQADAARLSPGSAQYIWDVAAKILCEGCRLDGLTEECYLCPGPQEFIEHLVEMAEAQLPKEEAA